MAIIISIGKSLKYDFYYMYLRKFRLSNTMYFVY